MFHRRRGFTLIELLVVIAIIGILAAMLFPVFARAREAARKIQCLSNVKNIAMAIQMYLADYDRFPPMMHDSGTIAYLQTAAGNPDRAGECSDFRMWKADPYLRWPVILDEYTKNRDVWRCPSARWTNGYYWVVPYYGGVWWSYLQANEGHWGQTDPDCGGGPCCGAFPVGWGGTITDSIKQHRPSDPGMGGFWPAIACTDSQLADKSGSNITDPAMLVVCGDYATNSGFIQCVEELVYDVNMGIYPSDLYCGSSVSWENCPGTQNCAIDGDLTQQWMTDASFRNKWTRHLGGANIGFADGHAKWWSADAAWAATAHCVIDPADSSCKIVGNDQLHGFGVTGSL